MKTSALGKLLLLSLLGLPAAWSQAYHAKIAVEGDTPLPTAPQVIPDNSSRLVPMCVIYNIFGNGTVEYRINWAARPYDPNTADACPVKVILRGYRTTSGTLRNGGVIVLKRIGDSEGSTISMSSLEAPKDARKAYEKGVAAMSQRKWAAAEKSLNNAVTIYPEYAQAWSELGEALREQSKVQEAQAAYEKALKADPKYVKPYVQLARLALNERNPLEALEITNRALEIKPVEFPTLFFYNAVANYELKKLDAAEESAKQAIGLDPSHEIPRAENLLGTVLAAKGDYKGALEHLRKYLEISPKAGDADEVKAKIAELQRRILAAQSK
jgi:tetratricopeptide (TPR) repeat protein